MTIATLSTLPTTAVTESPVAEPPEFDLSRLLPRRSRRRNVSRPNPGHVLRGAGHANRLEMWIHIVRGGLSPKIPLSPHKNDRGVVPCPRFAPFSFFRATDPMGFPPISTSSGPLLACQAAAAKVYKFLAPIYFDQESKDFRFPAQYMFKDVPPDTEESRSVALLIDNFERHNIEIKAMLGYNPNNPDCLRALTEHPDRFFTCFEIPTDVMPGIERSAKFMQAM